MTKETFKLGFTFAIIITNFSLSLCSNDFDDYGELKRNPPSQVEVRAVYINCQPDENLATDSETTRFERQELFMHNVLQDCYKKVAITVKMSSDSDQSLSEEYIPIDHVFEGPNKRRVRLLNPYVLRLRREAPLQAYKLRQIDTVTAVLTDTKRTITKNNRMSRGADTDIQDGMTLSQAAASVFTLEHDADGRQSYSVPVSSPEQKRLTLAAADISDIHNPKDCVREACPQSNITRETQSQIFNDDEQGGLYNPSSNLDREIRDSINDEALVKPSEVLNELRQNGNEHEKPLNRQRHLDSKPRHSIKSELNKRIFSNRDSESFEDTSRSFFQNGSKYSIKKMNQRLRYKGRHKDLGEGEYDYDPSMDSSEKYFTVFDIGNPQVLYNVHVQLLEKMSTPEATSVWNDLTQGQQANINAMEAEWSNQDMSLRYRPAEWVTREDFTLPTSSNLCLVVPLHDSEAEFYNDTDSKYNDDCIIVPVEDLVGLDIDVNKLMKRNNDSRCYNNPANTNEDKRRHVEIRVTRALFGGRGDNFNITASGSDQFLTMPYSKPYHAQIDLEVRADDNQLVRVGSSGSINTIVADNTRKTRTILIVQASNTGLASARYRAVARDCGPELSGQLSEAGSDGIAAGSVLLPPRHTRRLRLELPAEILVDKAHCSVALLNDDDESVAVRDVAIKKGDRCFCVWHCDCVCLSEDPKLLCREMSRPQLKAAGLPERHRPRQAHSVCYCDNITVNVGVVTVGIIFLLLALGLMKALAGLTCACLARLGLERILKSPRKLQHYYERNLYCRPVVYDSEGWPIHPDSKKRNVQLFSRLTTFVLNCIYFLVLPSIMLRNVVTILLKKFKDISRQAKSRKNSLLETKKCFSSQDVQSMEWSARRKQRPGLRQWMSPQADELTAQIWTGVPAGLDEMQPLLLNAQKSYANSEGPSCVDSEQDDTDYVLMQMQKSRESLAKSHKKSNDDALSSGRNNCRDKTTSKVNKNKR